MIKTITLTGKEVRVDGLGGFYAAVHNMSGNAVYASKYPNIKVGADDVAEIPSGGVKLITTVKDAVYLLGVGKVELSGQDHEGLDCSSSLSSVNVGGTSDITKEYVDAQDALNLEAANSYTDDKVSKVNDDVAELQTGKADKSELSAALDSANSYTDGQLSSVSESISALQNEKADKSELSETLASAKAYTNEQIREVGNDITELQDTKADKSEIPTVSSSNLLINPDFKINQRGQNEYTGTGSEYIVDVWSKNGGVNIQTLNNGIKIAASNRLSGNGGVTQTIEGNSLAGRTVTLSAYIPESTGRSRIILGWLADSVWSWQGTDTTNTPRTGLLEVTAAISSNASKITFRIDGVDSRYGDVEGNYTVVEWAKLEIGGKATPFIAPDPATELLKCQRYYQVFATEALRPAKAQDFRPAMYSDPKLGTISINNTVYYTASADL